AIAVSQVQKIDQRNHEHPDAIHERPIKAKDLEVVSLVAAALIADPNHNQSDYASGDVRKVQPGDAKKGRAEQPGSPGVLKQRHSLADQRHPLANMQQGKNDARGSGNKGPAESSRFVARLGGLDSTQHSHTAGHEDA